MLTREDLIEASCYTFVKAKLVDYSYDDTGGGNVIIREAFPSPTERAGELLTTTVAVNMHFDDGGRGIELGSNLTQYIHTLEYWVFAINTRMGRNLANVVKAIIRHEGAIPLLDVAQPTPPQIDALVVDRVAVTRQVNSSPRPWDENVWTCTVHLYDEYSY